MTLTILMERAVALIKRGLSGASDDAVLAALAEARAADRRVRHLPPDDDCVCDGACECVYIRVAAELATAARDAIGGGS